MNRRSFLLGSVAAAGAGTITGVAAAKPAAPDGWYCLNIDGRWAMVSEDLLDEIWDDHMAGREQRDEPLSERAWHGINWIERKRAAA